MQTPYLTFLVYFYPLFWFGWHTPPLLLMACCPRVFFHMFLPHYFLDRVIEPHSPTPPPATLPLDALPFHSIFWHLHCFAVSYPSCACFLLEVAPECLLRHASKCILYPVLAMCIHFLHTAHTFLLLVHGIMSNLGHAFCQDVVNAHVSFPF